MYKDFKKSESLDTGFVGGSGIIWMFSGIILGLLVGLGMYYFTNNNSSALSMASTVQNKIKQAQSARSVGADKTKRFYNQRINQQKGLEQDEPRKTKFSYYAVLPTLDVPVGAAKPIDTSLDILPNSKSSNIVSAPKTVAEVKQVKKNIEPIVPVVKDGNYLLQVASYKKKSRANVTRGRLAQNGIDAYIKSKKIKGNTWYRVVAGPVDQNSVDSWKSAAEKMGHRPLVISLR
ncbi:MAG: SPOR domain-containing protein [Cocleimonas sp.]|nr:SPOR domain-containing protein [Cocleimonas sp.]